MTQSALSLKLGGLLVPIPLSHQAFARGSKHGGIITGIWDDFLQKWVPA